MNKIASLCIKSIKKENPEPWKPFLIKASVVAISTVAICSAALSAFSSRFEIQIDPQVLKCLPEYSVYLIDKKDTVPVKGVPFAFKASGISKHLEIDEPKLDPIRPFYDDGKKLLKMVDAIPGDTVSISKTSIKVNGHEVGVPGLVLAKTIQREEKDFVRDIVVENNEYFFAGRTYDSFDSRYWGTVNGGQIIGRAYPLF